MSNEKRRISLWATVASVGAAFLGVQSDKNRARDFTSGKAWHFIVIGLVATALFIFAVWGLVQWVLSMAG